MPQIQSILYPADFSEFSVSAYEYAESLAWHYKAKLLLQHVMYSLRAFDFWDIYPSSYEEVCRKHQADVQRQLQEFALRHRRWEVPLQYFVEDGSFTDSILAVAEEQAVNLIVMGTHGSRGIDRLMLGSVTEKVLRRARCPVLAVRKPTHDVAPSASAPDAVYTRKILLCMDFFSSCSSRFEVRSLNRRRIRRGTYSTGRAGGVPTLNGSAECNPGSDGSVGAVHPRS